MRKKRLMVVQYTKEEYANRLKTCLDMCCISYVAIKEYDFIDGDSLWDIFIDRGSHTWRQIIDEVNRVHAVQVKYINDTYIKNGMLYTDC